MRKGLVVLLALALSACANFNKSSRAAAGMGVIRDQVSAFDNAREISMTPSPVIQHEASFSNCCSIGLVWKSSAPDQATVTVEMNGIQRVASAEFRIDDRIVTLQPTETFTAVETERAQSELLSTSSKLFRIKMSELQALANAKAALIRVSDGRDYVLGELSRDPDGGMFPTLFKEWLALIPAQ